MSKLKKVLALMLTMVLVMSMFVTVQASSEITLPDLISDNMLIQRDAPIKLWGFGGNEGDVLKVVIENEKGEAVNQGETKIGADGFDFELSSMPAGGPYTIRFTDANGKALLSVRNVLIGDLYFQGGQSNMQLKISAIPENIEERVNPNPKDDTIRLFYNGNHFYADEPQKNLEGKWIVTDKYTVDYSAVGYGALETIHNELGIPVGGICATYGGSGISQHVAPNGNVYKAKIAPVTNFNIKGIMWYQGETDRTIEMQGIENSFNILISSLRQAWGNENLPFFLVQLHPSPYKGLTYGSTEEYSIKDFSHVRIAQSNVYVTDKNVGMVTAMDLNTAKYNSIGQDPSHPYIKQPIGKRLGNLALEMVYGKDIKAKMPVYTGYSVEGNTIKVTVQDAYDGLKTSDGKAPWGFMIAGEDGVYYEADATLSGNTITLKSGSVSAPVSASYGYERHHWPYDDVNDVDNAPETPDFPVNVVNSAGLPLGAFDTTQSKVLDNPGAEDVTTDVPADTPQTTVVTTPVATSGDKTILYVAPNGSDSNSGTIDAPFASFEKAQSTIRQMKADGSLGEGGAVVYFREGEYLFEKGIKFSKEDSGTKDAPIVYRNYPDEEVLFSGGMSISPDKFKKVTDKSVLERIVDEKARENIVAVNIKDLGIDSIPEPFWPGAYSYWWSITELTGVTKPQGIAPELLIDGTAMTVARYPNDGYMIITQVLEQGEVLNNWEESKKGTDVYIAPEDRKDTPFTVTVEDERVSNWTEAEDALLTGSFAYSWADQTIPLGSVKPEKKSITSAHPSVFGAVKGQHFYIYNLIEEIDMPGEYFADRKKGIIYLYPPESGIGETVYTLLNEHMFRIVDTEYVTFKGLKMGYMRNSAIDTDRAKGVVVEDCEIFYTGNCSIALRGTENRIYDCYIHDVEGGVKMNGGDRETLTPSGSIVENCEFERCDRISKTYMMAIDLGGVGTKALNNKVHDAVHAVVRMLGNDHVIAYNEIYDACNLADDMGAIYTGRVITNRGNKILSNYIHDIATEQSVGGHQGVHGIFLDDYYSAALIEGNVFENITGAGAMFAGSDNIARNNIFVNVGENEKGAVNIKRSYNYGVETSMNQTFLDELKSVPYYNSELWLERYPELANVLTADGLPNVGKNIQVYNNALFNSEDVAVSEEIRKFATLKNNISFSADPGFYDLENRNYLLNEDSAVYEKIPEFKPIIFTRMGQYTDRALARINNAYAFCIDSPYLFANGERVKEEKMQAFVENETVYVPLRSGAKAIGAEIGYDEATEKISVAAEGKAMEFTDGATEKVNINGAEYNLAKPIINIDHTNYIALADLVAMFDKQLIIHDGVAVVSDTEGLFNLELDENLLRYIKGQLSVY